MTRVMKKTAGVTLLEVLLVLAIAAMIIVLSIRYYQGASTSQQANMALEEIQAITAAADNLAIGNTSGYSGITTAQLQTIVSAAGLISPNGGSIVFTPTGASTYTVVVPLGTAACGAVSVRVSNSKMTGATCGATGFSYTYDNTK